MVSPPSFRLPSPSAALEMNAVNNGRGAATEAEAEVRFNETKSLLKDKNAAISRNFPVFEIFRRHFLNLIFD